MNAERLLKGTWLGDFGENAITAYSEMPEDDLLISVSEIEIIGGVFAVALFNVKLLDAEFQEGIWTKLTELDPFIQRQAQDAEVGLRGVLVRIMDAGFTYGYIDSEAEELRLSFLSQSRGNRCIVRACDMLMKLADPNHETYQKHKPWSVVTARSQQLPGNDI